MIAISMENDELSAAKRTLLLSRLGKRDLILSAALIFLPILLVSVFKAPVSGSVYSVSLGLGVFLFIRTWSRELNWATLASRYKK